MIASAGADARPRRTAGTTKRIARALAAAGAAAGSAGAIAQVSNDSGLPQVYTMSPTGVNLQTGKFAEETTDIVMGPLKLVRGGHRPAFGAAGFVHNLGSGVRVTTSGNDIVAHVFVAGEKLIFYRSSTGWASWAPKNPDTSGHKLTHSGGKFTLVDRAGTVYTFMQHVAYTNTVMPGGTQVLEHARHPDGTLEQYSYNGAGKVRTVINSRGYAIVMDYSGAEVSAACGYNAADTFVGPNTTCAGATIKTSYGYDLTPTWAYLTSVTDVSNAVTGYQYTNGLVTCITLPYPALPASPTCKVTITYGPDTIEPFAKPYQTRRQVMATGEEWTFRYDNGNDPEDPAELPLEERWTWSWMTDPAGNETAIGYADGYARELYQPAGVGEPRTLTQYSYNGIVVKSFIMPEGNEIELVRDGRQNIVEKKMMPKTGQGTTQAIVTQSKYPYNEGADPQFTPRCGVVSATICNKPLWTKDALGRQTDYTYYESHGGIWKETGPPVDGASGVRPQTRHTYEERTPWLRNESGQWTEGPPITVLKTVSVCKTGGYTDTGCVLSGDEVVTTYEYGPVASRESLQVRGVVVDSGGLALRTCYTYDAQGNRTSETTPRAGVLSCP
jgi:hypothetical protein